ncbi:carboxypeptidase-like protein [Neolewinella xylanilytica]|uniref:Carboxypeptidase-like protein n=1 Tax=Neolewinella xylanilytica TaxID=1514080 RepID=A0A2S6IB46_9BACT|nr:TonB-dependent receptor [Neolewinella xylanilytica]PPK88705.1 carboxypeptidase-like protein [Neolewinella xylanilytica]
MFLRSLLFLPVYLLALSLTAQTTVSGYLTDGANGEALLAANVIELGTGQGAVANEYGFYSLTLGRRDTLRLRFSYIGYGSRDTTILNPPPTLAINQKLQTGSELETVVITSDHGERIEQRTQMSTVEIPVAEIKRVPALLGEVDVLKTLQLLPGVQSGGEGASGLYVRGGSPDQNLVLLDGVPIYNVSHLLGVFSIFNADALRNVTLTKGGFPARYGGRLSSVLSINMKEGNLNEWEGEGSVGLISSKLTLNGPIKKGRTSLLVSGRRTYADLIAGPLLKRTAGPGTETDLGLYFYDLNAKLQHKISDRHRVFLSFYNGSDVFRTEISEGPETYGGGTDWGNLISAARWNWQVGPRLFVNTTATFSRYRITVNSLSIEEEGEFRARYLSGITDLGGKVDIDYIPNPDHYLRFGGGYTNHAYRPGAVSLLSRSEDAVNLDTLIGSTATHANELYAYAEDDITLGALKVNAGLHLSGFAVRGKFYSSLQPRLGVRYLLRNDLSLKASYSRMQQYINLLASESLSLPTDLWVPSTEQVRPQQSWQVAVGAAKTYRSAYEVSVEAFYKNMDNVLSFREGASFLLGLESDWQTKVTQGQGEAYGAEFFIQKKEGRFTGWVGYTLSWNTRQFDEINGGRAFPFRYDRRHDLSLVGNYDLSERVGLSGAFVYGTGNAVTLPVYTYAVVNPQAGSHWNDNLFLDRIETSTEKNSFRMSNYHRLDLSISFRKQKKWGERSWVISLYNAYWHRNPYFMEVGPEWVCTDHGNGSTSCGYGDRLVVSEVSILPLIPSVAYNFKF